MSHKLPDVDLLRSLLDYNPITGEGVWKVSISNRAPVGTTVKVPQNIKNRYKRVTIKGKTYAWHRVAYKIFHGELEDSLVIDHINGNQQDNSIKNLRLVERGDNQRNQVKRKNNTSGHMGVSFNKKHQKWETYITYENKLYKLGYYESIEKAIRVRKKFEKKFGFHINHGRVSIC